MSPTKKIIHALLGLTLAAPALEHCGGPSLRLRAPPTLSPAFPTPPPAPAAVRQESSQRRGGEGQRITSTRAPTNLREQTVLLVIEGDAALGSALRALLPTALVGARFTRVLLPPTLDGVTGSVERGASGERTTLSGPAERLLPMRASTPIDAVLRLELSRHANIVDRSVRFQIPADALTQYAAAFERYRRELEQVQRRLAAVADYPAEAERSLQSYLAAGGRAEDDATRARVEEARAFATLVAQLNERLRNALSAPPPTPEEAQRQASARAASSESAEPGVRIRAILSDLRAGETFWVDEVVARGDESAALSQGLSTLLSDLGGAPAARGEVGDAPSVVP